MRLVFGIFIWSLLIYGCTKSDNHLASAFRDGWSGDKPKSQEKLYLEDYEMGQEAARFYDLGFDDGWEKRAPHWKTDTDYMDGYKDGKEARKKRGY